MNKIDNEKVMLYECAENGFASLDKYFQRSNLDAYISLPFTPPRLERLKQPEYYLYHNNLDAFYAFLSVLYSSSDSSNTNSLIARKNLQADQYRALEFIETALYQESEFERKLSSSVCLHSLLSDYDIKTKFQEKFNIVPVNMLELPTDRSVYFAKVNHGYWEYLRCAYSTNATVDEQFREIDVKTRVRRLRTSAITQFWGAQIAQYYHLSKQSSRSSCSSYLCVSLTAGTYPISESIRNKLNPVTRGAAVGLLSMFDSALPNLNSCQIGDGKATRSLITEKRLEEFFTKYIADTDACLFVVPPHLKNIGFVHYKGDVHKFLVPPTRINETWKSVAATLLGYLLRMVKKYQSITILAQGASVASLLSLLIADMQIDLPAGTKIRFFDLGRVLDVANPEALQKQFWATKFQDDYIAEGKKVFCNSADVDFTLATAL